VVMLRCPVVEPAFDCRAGAEHLGRAPHGRASDRAWASAHRLHGIQRELFTSTPGFWAIAAPCRTQASKRIPSSAANRRMKPCGSSKTTPWRQRAHGLLCIEHHGDTLSSGFASDLGVKMPNDLAVAGFDDFDLADLHRRPSRGTPAHAGDGPGCHQSAFRPHRPRELPRRETGLSCQSDCAAPLLRMQTSHAGCDPLGNPALASRPCKNYQRIRGVCLPVESFP